jgi:predicted PurR-regulated permease PerM
MSNSNDNQNGWHQLTQGAPLAVLVAAVLYILYKLLPVLKLIAVAMLIAVILRTLLKWLEQIVKVRWIAVLLLFSFIVGFFVFLVAVVIPSVIAEVKALLVAIPSYLNSLINLSGSLHRNIRFIPDLSQSLTEFKDFTAQIFNSFPPLLQQAFDLTIQAVAMLILSLYIAYDPRPLISGFLRVVPRRYHQRVRHVIEMSEVRLRGWIFGTGIAMLFLGVGATLGLLALKIPLALPFGVIAGLFEVIPYFGSIVGTFLPALVALTISPLKLALVLLLFLILNQVDAYIVQPLVMGQQVDLHPVMVILTFLVMGKLLGLVGILLAVPTVAVLVTLIDEFTEQDPVVTTPLNVR